MTRWQDLYDDLTAHRYPALLAYAVAFTGHDAAAEDLVQEALVRTFSSTRRLTSLQHAEHKVRRSIAATFVNDRKRETVFQRTQARLALTTATSPHDSSAPTGDVAADEQDPVLAAMRELPPPVRACVVLRYYDDLAIAQVARALRLSVRSVKRNVHDAGAALRAMLGADEDQEIVRVVAEAPGRGGR